MTGKPHSILITPAAAAMLDGVEDARLRRKLVAAIDELAFEPKKQGKPLKGGLAGLMSKRVTQRFRVIYGVETDKVQVLVLAVGRRKEGSGKDIYRLAKKLMDLDLA